MKNNKRENKYKMMRVMDQIAVYGTIINLY